MAQTALFKKRCHMNWASAVPYTLAGKLRHKRWRQQIIPTERSTSDANYAGPEQVRPAALAKKASTEFQKPTRSTILRLDIVRWGKTLKKQFGDF